MADKEFKPPYTPIPSILLASTQLNESPSAWASRLAVYAHIRSHKHNDEQKQCFPGNETIAKEVGLSVATVLRAKRDLLKLGALRVIRGYQSSIRYEFPLDPPFNPTETLKLMKDLDRKDKKSILGNWVENAEKDFLDPPLSNHQENPQRSPVTFINKDSESINVTHDPNEIHKRHDKRHPRPPNYMKHISSASFPKEKEAGAPASAKPKKDPKKGDPRIQVFLDWFSSLFKELHKRDFAVPNQGLTRKNIQTLLKTKSWLDLQRISFAYLSDDDDDDKFIRNTGWSIETLLNHRLGKYDPNEYEERAGKYLIDEQGSPIWKPPPPKESEDFFMPEPTDEELASVTDEEIEAVRTKSRMQISEFTARRLALYNRKKMEGGHEEK